MFEGITDFVVNKIIKSEYVHAWILAQVRHIITAAGTAAVAKGWADDSLVQMFLGFALAAVGFYWAHLDVKLVDGKIKIALLTDPVTVKTIPVEVKDLPPIKS